jgi:hypothetical protein
VWVYLLLFLVLFESDFYCFHVGVFFFFCLLRTGTGKEFTIKFYPRAPNAASGAQSGWESGSQGGSGSVGSGGSGKSSVFNDFFGLGGGGSESKKTTILADDAEVSA